MLPDRYRRLLTAYVDGELSDRQREAVTLLVQRSAEARTLLEGLQRDSAWVRDLPRQNMADDLSAKIQEIVGDRQPTANSPAPRQPSQGFTSWVGVAAAAAVLLGVTLSSYFYFADPESAPVRTAPLAEKKTHPRPEEEKKPDPTPTAMASQPEEPREKPTLPKQGPSETIAVAKSREEKKSPVPPEAPADEALTIPNPIAAREVFEKIDVRLGLSLSLRELSQEKPRKLFQEELRKDSSYRLDLTALGNGRAFERLQEAFKTVGLRLLVDQQARVRLKEKRLKTDYVIFSEELSAEELARLFERIGAEEAAAVVKKADFQFGELLVSQLTKPDHVKLSELLGVDPTQLPPPPRGPRGVDISKPLSEGTAADLAKALAGQGGARPGAGSTAPPPDRLGLVLPCNPVRSKPTASKELKQFLDSRKPRRPGALQILLFLRGANG